MLVELNIDALVGPTHHYGGIGHGNVASVDHGHQPSHPRRAALEGLEKAMFVASLGIPQFVLPPPRRPLESFLRALGFAGPVADLYRHAREAAPAAYSAAFSSAFMWAANAATFAPACDCADDRHHLTLANLCSSWHRLPESFERKRQLTQLLSDLQDEFVIDDALPPILPLRDEGAANHIRLCDASGERGLHLFIYGESDASHVGRHESSHENSDGGESRQRTKPMRFMARHTLSASQAIARLHRLPADCTMTLQQHPEAIDAGVFHNDVIATSHQNVLLHHERAFLASEAELSAIDSRYAQLCGRPLLRICVRESEVSLEDAVRSYLFNSQLLTPTENAQLQTEHPSIRPSGDQPRMILLCAAHCQRTSSTRRLIESWIADGKNPIDDVRYVSLEESMSNGGGPACLRLRMQLPPAVINRLDSRYRLTPRLYDLLARAIEETYPERLDFATLAEPENLAQYDQAYERLHALFSNVSR